MNYVQKGRLKARWGLREKDGGHRLMREERE